MARTESTGRFWGSLGSPTRAPTPVLLQEHDAAIRAYTVPLSDRHAAGAGSSARGGGGGGAAAGGASGSGSRRGSRGTAARHQAPEKGEEAANPLFGLAGEWREALAAVLEGGLWW